MIKSRTLHEAEGESAAEPVHCGDIVMWKNLVVEDNVTDVRETPTSPPPSFPFPLDRATEQQISYQSPSCLG